MSYSASRMRLIESIASFHASIAMTLASSAIVRGLPPAWKLERILMAMIHIVFERSELA
jgi:hypothetical protein